jgi:hypothetical protein
METAVAQVLANLRGTTSAASDGLLHENLLSGDRLKENLKQLQDTLDEFFTALDDDTQVAGHVPLLRAGRRLRRLLVSLQS